MFTFNIVNIKTCVDQFVFLFKSLNKIRQSLGPYLYSRSIQTKSLSDEIFVSV